MLLMSGCVSDNRKEMFECDVITTYPTFNKILVWPWQQEQKFIIFFRFWGHSKPNVALHEKNPSVKQKNKLRRILYWKDLFSSNKYQIVFLINVKQSLI